MLKYSSLIFKANRNWAKPRLSKHFPLEVAPDPASMRGSEGAKEKKVFFVSRDGIERNNTWAGRLILHLKNWAELIRLDKPVGTHLLFLPCMWGTALATTRALVYEGADPIALCAPFVPIHLLISFYIGAFTMRSAGCIINDMWDRDLDRQVERCKNRPLASGAITMMQASSILTAHCFIGAIILANLSPVAIQATLASVPIAIIYPLMKRVTFMPQVILGLCFNIGIFVGYAAVLNRIDPWVTVPIYLAAVCWTVLYDTIYAYQDKKDDLKAGVKSTAILFGDTKLALYLLQAPIGLGFAVSGLAAPQSLFYFLGLGWAMYYLNNIVDHVNIHDGWSCNTGFKRNIRFGLLVLLAMMAGNAFWAYASQYNPKKDKQSVSSESTLLTTLALHNERAIQAYDPSRFNWVDRFLKPAFVQSQCLLAEDSSKKESDIIIPAWMRREYLGENVSNTIRYFFRDYIDESTIREYETKWYSIVDHYNIFAAFSL